MPVRRRKQSNAMLYTLIIFVGLFIASTTIAVIYYVKAEEHRNAAETNKNDLRDIVGDLKTQDVENKVGTRLSGESLFGTTIKHLDDMVTLIVGGVAEDKSAEVKVDDANSETQKAFELAGKYINISDPNTIGFVPIVNGITAELQSTIDLQLETQKSLNEKLIELKNTNEANTQKEQAMLAEKEKLLQDVEQAKQDYKELQDLLRQSTEEQVRNLTEQVQEITNIKKALEDRLDLKEAELAEARKEMKFVKEQLAKLEPGPDQEVLAYQPDGKIILVDNNSKVVNLNIGSNDHVYRGLTFTVYDRGTSVQPEGKGKAEIKVFDVAETYSTARIIESEITKPVLLGDIVANLIWDSTRTNVFTIAGDFDLDGDGQADYNAIQRIKALIEKWGGRVDDKISIDTDFLILGQIPLVTGKPTLEEQQQDPTALQKYDTSIERLDHYNAIQDKAQTLWIPILTYDKFLYFIGYKTSSIQAGAF